ncbi:prepilin-type N-terminal cleavage/methylation domain-containing protein, partial [Candidatus Kaiserbacteria bacterium]|nr:prepilin-type N-terminal cleavage/methylation domain-containing protein [Candidatus Kaiserbacteria bacterium]
MNLTKQKNKGFGLIELLVAISVMTIVSATILTKHKAFDSAVVLRNQAYEVAFTLREAQNLAVSAAYNPDSATGNEYRQRYGVRFDLNEPRVYRLFKDNDGNGVYTHDSGEEYGAPGILDPRFSFTYLKEISGDDVDGPLEVMFERPNFDAVFDPTYLSGGIVIGLSAENGMIREIQVTRTGQISVLD